MRRRLYGIIFFCCTFIIGYSLLNQIQNQGPVFCVSSLITEQPVNLSFFANVISYDLDGYNNEEYFYTNGTVEPVGLQTDNGIYNTVFLDSLSKIYDWAEITTGDYETLTNQFGQYTHYNSYPDAECFVFNDWYSDIYKIHLFVTKNSFVFHKEFQLAHNLDYTPLRTARDGDNYFVLLSMDPNDMYSDSELYYAIATINIKNGDGDIKYVKLNKGSVVGMIADEKRLHIGFEGADENYIILYDWNTETYEVLSIEDVENIDFLLRDDTSICYGGIQLKGDNSVVSYTICNMEYQKFYTAEISLPYRVEYGIASCFEKGMLFVDLWKLAGEENLTQGIAALDTIQGKLVDLMFYQNSDYNLVLIRFMDRLSSGKLVDLPYAAN